MVSLAIHGAGIVEPALRQRVLAVIAVADLGIASALLARIPALGRIHIPDLAVIVDVRRAVEIPQSVVAHCSVRRNLIAERRKQGRAAFPLAGIIISRRFGAGGAAGRCDS